MSRSLSARIRRVVVAGAACTALFAIPSPASANPNELAPKHLVPTVSQAHDSAAQRYARPTGSNKTNGINYYGGPVMTAGPNAYIIWYGNWSGDSATSLIPGFLGSVGGSPYFNINTTYYDGSKTKITNAVRYAGSTTDNYSRGTTLTDADVQSVVADAINSGRLQKDTNGVYFVLTSGDVGESSGFLTQYCGWHTHGTIAGSDIKYSFVGDPSLKPTACSVQSTSPNGNAMADAMISVIAHELEEATTDPDLNAWFDSRGYENADKCAWTFGTTSTASNGSMYNITLNGKQYLIQRNWVNASGGYCSMSY